MPVIAAPAASDKLSASLSALSTNADHFVSGARNCAPSSAWNSPGLDDPRRPPRTSSGHRLSCPTRIPVVQFVTAGPEETITTERNSPDT